MIGWAIYELTPAPWGDDYRFIVRRDTEEDAIMIIKLLNLTNYDFSVYKIIELEKPETVRPETQREFGRLG